LATAERDLVNGVLRQDAYVIHVWDTRTGEQLAEMDARAPAGARAGGRRGKTLPAGRGTAETKANTGGNWPGNGAAGGGAAPWLGNMPPGKMPGAGAQNPYEAFAGVLAPRLVFSPDAARLALISGGFGADATVDLWNFAATVSPHDSLPAAQLEEAQPPPAKPERKEGFRTWTSADGKFTIRARLLRVDGDAAILKKESGKEVKVSLEKFSEEDQNYVQERALREPDAPEKYDP
jgi:hypothetical protein